MTTLALFVLLASPQAPASRVKELKAGESWAIVRRARWVNVGEEIDYLQEDRYELQVLEADGKSARVKIVRQMVATEWEGERIPADKQEDPTTWVQTVEFSKPAGLYDPKAGDRAETRLGQLSLFWLPGPGNHTIPDTQEHEAGAVTMQVSGTDELKLAGSGSEIRLQGSAKTWPKVDGYQLKAPNQLLPNSGFRGELTLEIKLAPKG